VTFCTAGRTASRMSRSQTPPGPVGPYTDFAARLRELKKTSGKSYRGMSKDSGYTVSTLAAAVRDDSLPSADVMLAFVRSCGGDEREWQAEWEKVRPRGRSRRRASPHADTPKLTAIADPASVATPADLTAALNRLWTASGRMSLRQLEISSGGTLRRTTVHDVLTGTRIKPAWATVWELVKVFYGYSEKPDKPAWASAWRKARDWAESEGRRPRWALSSRIPVRSCNPVALGVHPGSAEGTAQPAYIERDIDSGVRATIRSAGERSRFILLIGAEGTGKTRLAYEALRAEAPGFGLMCPSSEEELKVSLLPHTVVWLDNIDRYLGWAALTPLLVQAMLRGPGPLIIVGTISTQHYSACVSLADPAADDDRQRQREVLNLAAVFAVPARLSAAELARAAEAGSDPRIATILQVTGPELFQSLAAGPNLARRWATADPYTRAVISAAADARRVGIQGPMPRHLLRDAAACYLRVRDLERAAPSWFDDALAYATTPVPGGQAPLIPDSLGARELGTTGYRIARYLLWLRESRPQQDLPPATGSGTLPAVGTVGLASEVTDEHEAAPLQSGIPPHLILDRHLVDEMTACDFTGPSYRAFEEDLAWYAIRVLSRWPHPAVPAAAGQDAAQGNPWLMEDQDDRLKLVMRTVADVLPAFRRKLAAGSREPGNGDSLTACFIMMCRAALPDRISKPNVRPAVIQRHRDRGNAPATHGGNPADAEALTNGSADAGGEARSLGGRSPRVDPADQEAVPYSSDGATVLRIFLGSHLRRLRESRGITAKQAAVAIRASESKISRIELGRNAIREIDVLDLLTLYSVRQEEKEQLLMLAEQANRPGWWHRYHDILPEWFHAYLGMEEVARSIRSYEPQLIPGLLQTEEYASAVISHFDFPAGEARRHVGLRKERQRRFREGKLKLWAIVNEEALRRPLAGADVQIGQLRYLREQCETRSNLTLQIIPYGVGGHAVPTGFSILRFAERDLPDVVYVESLTRALYLDKQAEVGRYQLALERLIGVASDPAWTIQTLDEILRGVKGSRKTRLGDPSPSASLPGPRARGRTGRWP
jgi:transcriptional regulator with XRE-family HTH domain